jgi:hypothetical protein
MAEPARLAGGQARSSIPIVAIRHRMTLDPRQTATIDIASGIAERARRRSASSASTRTGISPTASSTSPGRTAA